MPPRTDRRVQGAWRRHFNRPARAGTITARSRSIQHGGDALVHERNRRWLVRRTAADLQQRQGHPGDRTLKEITAVRPAGFATAANDDARGLAAGSRGHGARSGLTPGGRDGRYQAVTCESARWTGSRDRTAHTVLSGDGYALSAFSKQDPSLLFRIIATSSNEANMRGAAADDLPPRKSVLNDPELAKRFRYYPAALAALKTATPFPFLPEWNEVE